MIKHTNGQFAAPAATSPTGSQNPLCYRKLDPITSKVLVVNLQPDDPIQAWRRRSVDLAVWAEAALINRTDSYGRYTSFESRAKKQRGTNNYTCKYYPYRSVIEAHFRGYHEEEVIGFHSTVVDAAGQGWCRWGIVDIDRHDNSDDPSLNWSYAEDLYDRLVGLGFHPILEDSNGKGGFHLWIIFDAPVESERVFDLLTWLNRDWSDFGKGPAPEIFPKQRTLKSDYGNWLRVPGRHHTHFHWSMFWDGAGWLAGDQAIDFLIGTEKASASLIPPVSAATASRPRAKAKPPQTVRAPRPIPIPAAKENLQKAQAHAGLAEPAVSGEDGHGTAFKLIRELVWGHDLTVDQARPIAETYNQRCQPPWSAQELEHKLVEADTREFDLPRGYLLKAESAQPKPGTKTPWADRIATSPDAGALLAAENFNLTDLGNAARLRVLHGRDLRYCAAWKKWLVWDGRRWVVDRAGEAMRRAIKTVRMIYAEASHCGDSERREAICKHAMASERKDRITAMLALCEVEDDVPVSIDQLRGGPKAVVFRNGTVDLNTGILRESMRSDMNTQLCDVDFDPLAKCPTWDQTLELFFARNQELIGYFQRVCGAAVSGEIREHFIAIAHGSGSNGKSTVLGALIHAFGNDYSMKASADLLLADQRDSHPTQLADLFGKRLVVAIETEEGRRLAEGRIKELTGGDRIRARRMREDSWEFDPTHTIILATNHLPEIRGTDHGIWRRVQNLPFTVQIADEAADKNIPEKLCQERAGIMAWVIRGCREWLEKGLAPPEEVAVASASYRADQNLVGQFLAEKTIAKPGAKIQACHLYASFCCWAESRGEKPMSLKKLGPRLVDCGLQKKVSGGTFYLDRELAAPPADPEGQVDSSRSDEPAAEPTIPDHHWEK